MNRASYVAICVLLIGLVGCSGTTTPTNDQTVKPLVSDFLITNVSVRATRNGTPSGSMGGTSEHSMIATVDPRKMVSGVYLRIENRSSQDDQMLSVTADAAGRAEIHQTIVENDVARMQHMMEGITIPAKGVFEFKPGGYHIMLLDLKRELEPGQIVQLTLKFKVRGEITISAPVTGP